VLQVPKKDHEVVVMAPTPGKDFFEMIYFVLRGNFIVYLSVRGIKALDDT
jgi:hypothetical protein